MPSFDTRSKSLSQLYVFYNRLQDDGYGALYNNVKASLNTQSANLSEVLDSVDNLMAMSQAEARKEQALLRDIFGVNITVDLSNSKSIREFIDTLNACLNLKSVYERNIFLIKESKGAKGVISYFPTYFKAAWEKKWPTMIKQIEKALFTGNKSVLMIDAIEQIVDKYMSTIVNDAIKNMFKAERELKKTMPEILKDAYLELLGAIGKVRKQGSLASQLYNIYNLDSIKQTLTSSLSQANKDQYSSLMKSFNPESIVTKDFQSRGGLSLEAIENTVFSMLVDKVQQIKNVKVSGNVFATGALGVKADNVLTFNINPQKIEDILVTNEKVSRERNIKMFNQLGQNLKGVENGYVVYSSAKNYTINDNFKRRGGFSNGEISVLTYRNIMHNVNKNMDTFAGSILQTASGAIGDNGLKGKLESAIAQDIAYLLFDDIDTIGRDVDAGDGKAIHIMNLNGVYIPLSFFLRIFANAVKSSIKNPNTIAKASIYAPKIMFETQEDQAEWQASHPNESAWGAQQDEALSKTMISIHFLGSFQDIIQSYL